MYQFTRLKLDRREFENLVFMGEPPWWREDEERHRFLLDICYKPLKEVALKVIEISGLERQDQCPVKIFDSIDIIAKNKKSELEKEPWFKSHARLSLSFNKGLMDKIWIRNLASHERKISQNGSFYTEDGNHRALVYAVYLELGKAVYEPVDAIHATSWDIASGILGHRPQPADILENNGELRGSKHRKEKFHLPIGIQIDTYKRH